MCPTSRECVHTPNHNGLLQNKRGVGTSIRVHYRLKIRDETTVWLLTRRDRVFGQVLHYIMFTRVRESLRSTH